MYILVILCLTVNTEHSHYGGKFSSQLSLNVKLANEINKNGKMELGFMKIHEKFHLRSSGTLDWIDQ